MPLVVSVLAAGPLRAQQDSARAAVLDPITVTATRAPSARTKIGTAVSVVTLEAMRKEPPATAAEAVGRATGTFIDEAAGPGGPTIVRLRGGEETFSLILMDGVQLNQNGGFFDFLGLTLTNVERIEVSRGPQSALYGSTAVNGVVQFITRPGAPGVMRFTSQLSGGDAAVHGGAAQGAFAMGGGTARLRYSGGVGGSYQRGIFDVAHDTRTREVSARIDAAPTPNLDIVAVGRFIGVDSHLPIRDAGATRIPQDPNAQDSRDRWVALVRASLHRGAATHRFGVALYREGFLYDDSADGVSSPDFFVFDANFHLHDRLFRSTLEYQSTVDTRIAGAPVALAVGGQLERETLRELISGDFGPGDLALSRPSGALFTEAQATLGRRLHGLVGARLEKVRGLVAQLSPRANAVLDLSDGVALRASLGRAYKAPNLQDQYPNNAFIVSNPNLKPETSWSWEVGTRLRPSAGVSIEASWFRQSYGDLIRTVQSSSDTTRQENRNIGRARAQGVELEAVAMLPSGAEIEVGATALTTTVLDNTGLNPSEYPLNRNLPFRPAVVGYGAFTAPIGRRLEAVVRATVVGQQVVLTERFSGQRVVLDPYTLLGSTLTLHMSRGSSTFLKLDNVLGHRYQTGFDRRGIPRTATLGVRWDN